MTRYMSSEPTNPRRRGPGLASFLILIVVVLVVLVAWDNLVGSRTTVRDRLPGFLAPGNNGFVERPEDASPSVVQGTRNLHVTVDQASLDAVEVDYETAVLMDIYARGNPSVVQVNIFGDRNNPLIAMGQGTGFIWDNEGHIVTNAHVVQAANTMHITFQDGTMSIGEVLAQDPESDWRSSKSTPRVMNYNLSPWAAVRISR